MTGKSSPDIQEYDPKTLGRLLAEFSNYHKHGSFYTHEDGVSVECVSTGVFYLPTGFTDGNSSGAGYVVVDGATGNITIGDKGAGVYMVKGTLYFSSDKANVQVHFDIHKNGVASGKAGFIKDIGNANDHVGGNTQSALMTLVPDDVVDLRISSDVANTTYAIDHGGLTIVWIAGE